MLKTQVYQYYKFHGTKINIINFIEDTNNFDILN